MNRMTSPCIGICVMDEHSGYCLGCARTLGEIAEWSMANPSRRQQIISTLPSRRRSMAGRFQGRAED
ncbi:DUF1289 domain-containing protein [Sphingosinicella rhizophila]|uniref:DUF1289 domain-containing protein n=1 Tax=Sphingosinicella rhizophila TaxID=3050082 RepID=A0ABU3Q786_9SPHN|nr:DUF1289 domain-containing protein [Sphingosinicella sp. GR2756]MDT9598843.1 DUF1289 domain-containing protein [Sphingosinicella sp. GR2756]